MELCEQVVSLELAKKLKELGVEQESLFYWVERYNAPKEYYEYYPVFSPLQKLETRSTEDVYSAFTVAELGEMLPLGVGKDVMSATAETFKIKTNEYKSGISFLRGSPLFDEENTEANSRAKMLIYLKENKLLEVK